MSDPGPELPLNPLEGSKKHLRDFKGEENTVIKWARILLSSDMLTMDAFPDGRQLERMVRECILVSVAQKLAGAKDNDLQRSFPVSFIDSMRLAYGLIGYASNPNIKKLVSGSLRLTSSGRHLIGSQMTNYASNFRYQVGQAAHKIVNETWGLDGHRLVPKPIEGEKDKRVIKAAEELLHNNAFLLSKPDEKVSSKRGAKRD